MQYHCNALKATLRCVSLYDSLMSLTHSVASSGPNLLASHYLACALTLEVQGQELVLLLEIWEDFLRILKEREDDKRPYFTNMTSWCSVLNMCIENILSSGKPISLFLQNHRVTKLYKLLER